MNERLKRRKKGGEGTPKEQANPKAPEPLQPKYFESEIGEKQRDAAVEPPRPERRPETQADFQLVSRPQVDAEPVAAPASGQARPSGPTRRRRKRGGRRGGRRSAVETSPVEAAPEAEPGEGASGEGALPDVEEAAPHAEPLTPESAAAEPVPVAPMPAAQQTPVAAPQAARAHGPRAQAPQAMPAPARPSKGTVVLAIGLPGSGKSSWFKRHNIHPLSSDLLRELLFDDALEQRFQDLVFSNLRSLLKARLIARRPMNYVDATNLTPHDRHSWIKLAKDYGYDVQGLFFDVPLEVCLERHQRRGRVVPEDIMRKMAGKLKPPTFEEGFSKITVVRVKQKDNVVS